MDAYPGSHDNHALFDKVNYSELPADYGHDFQRIVKSLLAPRLEDRWSADVALGEAELSLLKTRAAEALLKAEAEAKRRAGFASKEKLPKSAVEEEKKDVEGESSVWSWFGLGSPSGANETAPAPEPDPAATGPPEHPASVSASLEEGTTTHVDPEIEEAAPEIEVAAIDTAPEIEPTNPSSPAAVAPANAASSAAASKTEAGLAVGMVVLAKYSGGQLHRATILEISDAGSSKKNPIKL